MSEQIQGELNGSQNLRPGKWRKVIPIIVILVTGIVVFSIWLSGRGHISTDDAQIEGDVIPISARVSGYVDTISVSDNQPVKANQLLVQLDRRDLDARVKRMEADLAAQLAQAAAATGQAAVVEVTAPAGEKQAKAAVSSALAAIAASQEQITSAQAQARSASAGVDAAQGAVAAAQSDLQSASAQVEAALAAQKAARADISSAEAQAKRTSTDLNRFKALYSNGAVSRQQLDAAEAVNTSMQAALESARERARGASAALEQAKAKRSSSEAGLKQANARLEAAKAAEAQALAGVKLAKTALSQANAGLTQARAGLSAAESAPQQVFVGKAQSRAAAARIRQSLADLRNARLQLSYTRVTAPVSGIVSRKSVQPGQFVQPGQLLMALVPLNNTWVVANFKETQVGRMRPGMSVTIKVDTYPGKTLHGRVDSIGAATGAKFSLLPAENATGNFVKVVQRIPVKIVFDRPIPRNVILRPGMNVVATVNVSGG